MTEKSKPLYTPNLPEQKVRLALLSCDAGKGIEASLERLNIELVIIPPCEDLPAPVRSHPDLLVHHFGSEQLLVYHKTAEKIGWRLEKAGFKISISSSILKPCYPYDSALDAASIGSTVFLNPTVADNKLLLHYKTSGARIIGIRQGYAKCSVLFLNRNTLITSDPSVCKAASEHGFKTLKINPGSVSLPGYTYGFIGGCGGMIDPNKLALSGSLRFHPDYIKIQSLLDELQIVCVCLADSVLTDIGGILPLTEEIPE